MSTATGAPLVFHCIIVDSEITNPMKVFLALGYTFAFQSF